MALSGVAAGSVGPAAGSVGTVETQLPRSAANRVRLDCGRDLHPVRVAYETYGTLSPARDNVILVCHALSGDAHAAGEALAAPVESTRDGFAAEDRDGVRGKALGWWDGMIGPGKAFDTDRFFVVSTNLLGGCRGTTGPSSIDPASGRPYGSDFPVITVADMVRTERAFLDVLGIERLAAVAGGSLGGMQALEWAILYPGPGRRHRADRQHARAAAPGHGLECHRPGVDPARPRLAGRPLLRHRAYGGRRHGRGPDGRPRHLSVRAGPGRQVRPAVAGERSELSTRLSTHRSPSPSRSSRSRATCGTRPTPSSSASTPTPTCTPRGR